MAMMFKQTHTPFDVPGNWPGVEGGRVPTGPYFREKSLFSIVALPALEKSLLLNIFDRSPGKVLIFNRCDKT